MVFIFKNDGGKKKDATDIAVELLELAKSQDKLAGVNRSSSIFPPPNWQIYKSAGLGCTGLG